MTLVLDLGGYRRLRGSVIGTVRATSETGIVFADGVNLSSAKSRRHFIKELRGRLNGQFPAEHDFEEQLLRLLEQAEAALADDPAPEAAAAAEDEERIESYAARAGRYEQIRVRETSGDPVEARIPLSNFLARVVEDVLVDDGAEAQRHFSIEGSLGGRPLPLVRISASEFSTLDWLAKHWGAAVRVLPGRREVFKDCLLAFSADARARTVYGHVGWRQVGGRLLHLHTGGAIGAAGVVPDLEVELDGRLGLYRLPPPPDGEPLRTAVRASWELWPVAQPSLSAPLLGAGYGAVLAEWLRPDFSLWIRGLTGKLKTSYAAVMLAHYGAFDAKTMPANWESTVNALERASFLVKDAPFVVDDFRPPSDRFETGEMRRKAARLLRAAGNRTGRARMRADTSLRPEYYPRGIVIVTAEEGPPGESTAARLWELPVESGTVDLGRLTAAQRHAQAGLLGQALAGYVRWLAQAGERDGAWLQAVHQQALDRTRGVGGHLRHPQTYAYLLTAWSVFAQFAGEVGAVTEAEAAARLAEVDQALRAVAERQVEAAQDVRPDAVFIRTLGDLLAGGRGHLCTPSGEAPSDFTVWGWRQVESDDGEQSWTRPQGEKLGWVDETCLYLIPSAAHRLVAKAVGERGESFLVSERALHEALERGRYLVPGTKGRRHNKQAEGRVHNVVQLDRRRVLAAWEDGG